jgi:hypothetical protein
MEVSDQLHALAALLPGKEPLVPILQEAGEVPKLVWMWWQSGNKNPLPAPARDYTPVIQPITSSLY